VPDTAPGRVTDASGWPGRWETITREEYLAAIAAEGGLEALTVASSCTQPDPERYYVLTAWARRGDNCPLVQSELKGCDTSGPAGHADCPGTHTFSKFRYELSLEDDDA